MRSADTISSTPPSASIDRARSSVIARAVRLAVDIDGARHPCGHFDTAVAVRDFDQPARIERVLAGPLLSGPPVKTIDRDVAIPDGDVAPRERRYQARAQQEGQPRLARGMRHLVPDEPGCPFVSSGPQLSSSEMSFDTPGSSIVTP